MVQEIVLDQLIIFPPMDYKFGTRRIFDLFARTSDETGNQTEMSGQGVANVDNGQPAAEVEMLNELLLNTGSLVNEVLMDNISTLTKSIAAGDAK
jgi:hypothetical protein